MKSALLKVISNRGVQVAALALAAAVAAVFGFNIDVSALTSLLP